MTSAQLAALHAACFTVPRPWSETEFAQLAALPRNILLTTSRSGPQSGRVPGPDFGSIHAPGSTKQPGTGSDGDAAAALAVVQVVAGEAELLTIATLPALRRQGLGAAILARALAAAAASGATRIFLEVAADNTGAIALYLASGFTRTGRRKGYYRHEGLAIDALLMERSLPAA